MEDVDYVIVSPDVWRFFELHYGGIPIKRYGTREDEDTSECIIEVNLQKLYAFDIPKETRQACTVEVIQVPKNYTLADLKQLV